VAEVAGRRVASCCCPTAAVATVEDLQRRWMADYGFLAEQTTEPLVAD